jgi:hypothetical protein
MRECFQIYYYLPVESWHMTNIHVPDMLIGLELPRGDVYEEADDPTTDGHAQGADEGAGREKEGVREDEKGQHRP